MSEPRAERGRGWCSLRLRFEARELELLHGSEQVRGAALAAHGRAPAPGVGGRETLRTALTLAKAGHKVGHAAPGASVSLDEGELRLLLDAVHFAGDEVHWVTNPASATEADPQRRDAVLQAFPELVERGLWRSFGLTRDLDALAQRLRVALSA